MTRDELLAALPHIGWSSRAMSPVRDGVAHYVRLVNHLGYGTGIQVTPDRLEVVTPETWGTGADRTGSHGSVVFCLANCRLDLLPGCVSIVAGNEGEPAFVNLYNHDRDGNK